MFEHSNHVNAVEYKFTYLPSPAECTNMSLIKSRTINSRSLFVGNVFPFFFLKEIQLLGCCCQVSLRLVSSTRQPVRRAW